MQNALARNTDPITSDIAAEDLIKSGRLAWQKSQVMQMMKGCVGFYNTQDPTDGPTSAELAFMYNEDRYMVARRLPDLEKQGLVKKVGMRQCRVSGRQAVVWRLV